MIPSWRPVRSGRKPSSSAQGRFEELATAISAGADWIVTSDRPSAPAAGKPVDGRYDVILIFDGGSRGNPGDGYGSFTYKGSVVRWPTGIDYPGVTTNNQAEYQTMIAGLRAILFDCEALGIPAETISVAVRSDSQLLVNQVNGDWKIKHPGLKELHAEATGLLGRFRRWELIWHPRAESVRILGH